MERFPRSPANARKRLWSMSIPESPSIENRGVYGCHRVNYTRNNVRYVFECAACNRLFTRRRYAEEHGPKCGRASTRGAYNHESPSSSSDLDDSESVTVCSIDCQSYNVHMCGANKA